MFLRAAGALIAASFVPTLVAQPTSQPAALMSARAASWRLTSTALFDIPITAIAIDPSSSNTIYAGAIAGVHFGRHGVVFRSDDAGATWRELPNGLSGGLSVVNILVNPVDPDVVYVGTYGGGVFKSVDRGESWTRLQPASTPWVNALDFNERDPDTLYVALAGDGIYKTTDAGSTWTLVSADLGTQRTLFVISLLLDPVDYSRIYAVTSAHELFRSDDAGAGWHLVRSGIAAIVWVDPTDSSVLYALAESGGLERDGV